MKNEKDSNLNNKFAKLEEEINSIVYELYNLKEEEINIIKTSIEI